MKVETNSITARAPEYKPAPCPRCGDGELPEGHPGALSRVEDIEVCPDCGTDEAMRDFFGRPLTPPERWPVKVQHEGD